MYRTFIRTWWIKTPTGRKPGPGRKTHVETGLTMDEARRMCRQYNDTHDPGPLSRKMEFEAI